MHLYISKDSRLHSLGVKFCEDSGTETQEEIVGISMGVELECYGQRSYQYLQLHFV